MKGNVIPPPQDSGGVRVNRSGSLSLPMNASSGGSSYLSFSSRKWSQSPRGRRADEDEEKGLLMRGTSTAMQEATGDKEDEDDLPPGEQSRRVGGDSSMVPMRHAVDGCPPHTNVWI